MGWLGRHPQKHASLTIKIQLNVGIAFAQLIFRGDFVFARVGGVDIVDFQTGHIGVVRQRIAVDEITTRILYRNVITRPEELRFGIRSDFTLEDQTLPIVLLLDNRLLDEGGRSAVSRAEKRQRLLRANQAARLLRPRWWSFVVGGEVQVDIRRHFAGFVFHDDLVRSSITGPQVRDFQSDIVIISSRHFERLFMFR